MKTEENSGVGGSSPSPWTTLNLNVQVRVKLTDLGHEAYRQHQIKHDMKVRMAPLDADGYYRAPLWDLMHIFGDSLSLGFYSPFENNNIEIGQM